MRAVSTRSGIHRITFGKGRWTALALCAALAACQAPEAGSATAVAPTTPASSTMPATAPTSIPDTAPKPATVADTDGDDMPAPLPDASYTKADLRPSYDRCVDASQAATAELESCGDEELAYQEDRLAEIVAKVVASPDSKAKDDWMDAQAAWWVNTNRYCDWDPKTGGQGQMLDAQSCRINRVANRATELQALTSNK